MSAFNGGFGILTAPKVQLLDEQAGKSRTMIFHEILSAVQKLNNSVQQSHSGHQSLEFSKKSGEKKCVLIRTSSNGWTGFSLDTTGFQGDAMFYVRHENGKIEINGEKYKVFLLDKSGYARIKEENPNGKLSGEHGEPLDVSAFEEYWRP